MFGRSPGTEDIDQLIAKKKYGKAIQLARERLSHDASNPRWRQQLANLLALDGQTSKAVTILARLASEFVDDGFDAKGIALLKRIQRLEPGHRKVEEKLATLIGRRYQAEDLRARLPREESAVENKQEPLTETESAPVLQRLREEAHPVDELPQELAGIGISPLFANFPHDELLAFIQGLELETLEPGEIVVTEGEPGDSLFVLAAGTVRVFVRNASGRSEQVRLLHQGDFFGEISLLTKADRTATIVCATECDLLTLDRSGLRNIAKKNPQVADILRDIYGRRANSLEEREARGEPVRES